MGSPLPGRRWTAASTGYLPVPSLTAKLISLPTAIDGVFAGSAMELHVAAPLNEADNHAFECLLIADATGSYFHFFKASAVGTTIAQGVKLVGPRRSPP
jgi:hypothetical protein